MKYTIIFSIVVLIVGLLTVLGSNIAMGAGKDLLHFDGKRHGDVKPFYWKGEYHVFGVEGGWGHGVSKDLINWEILPHALQRGKPDEPDGQGAYSGGLIEHNGVFHIYYTGNNAANLVHGPECTMHATSTDLINFTKLPEIIEADGIHYRSIHQRSPEQQKEAWPEVTPDRERFRDPRLFWNEDEKQWWMITSALDAKTKSPVMAVLTSKDLKTWKQEPPLINVPGCDCPDVFKIGDWWYCIGHINYYRSKNPRGPYEQVGDGSYETPFISVPQRMYDGKRHLLAGHVLTIAGLKDSPFVGFGGPAVRSMFRELYADEDGELCLRPAEEYFNIYTKTVIDLKKQPKPDMLFGKHKYKDGELVVNPSKVSFSYNRAHLSFDVPASYMLNCTASLTGESRILTVGFREQKGQNQAPYRLHILPGSSLIEMEGPGISFRRICKVDASKPINVQAFVQGTFIELFVNEKYAFTFRAFDFPKGRLSFDVTNRDLSIQEFNEANGDLRIRKLEVKVMQ